MSKVKKNSATDCRKEKRVTGVCCRRRGKKRTGEEGRSACNKIKDLIIEFVTAEARAQIDKLE